MDFHGSQTILDEGMAHVRRVTDKINGLDSSSLAHLVRNYQTNPFLRVAIRAAQEIKQFNADEIYGSREHIESNAKYYSPTNLEFRIATERLVELLDE